jgi:hypothetical protein
MLGLNATKDAPQATAPSPYPVAAHNPQHRQTILGIAVPGIAPLQDGSTPGNDVARGIAGAGRTLVGSPDGVLPPPAPLVDLPPPPPPQIVRAKGVPLLGVALSVGAVVLVGGITIAWCARTTSTITAQARSAPDGRDILHIHCDVRSCKDGTSVEIGGARALLVGGEADLTLDTPLHVGQNSLSVRIDRPGIGRDEMVTMPVPVAFRIGADVAPMSGPHPSIVIRVQAAPGSDVTIEGKHVTLDGDGTGAYAIDESAATDGPADESKVISVDVPYSIVSGGSTVPNVGRGTISARVPIAPLRVDSPRGRTIVEADHLDVAGRAPKGATVTVDGAAVGAGPEGAFETSVPLAAFGERVLEVRAGTPALSVRTVRLSVKRVQSLKAEAIAFEEQRNVGYDEAMAHLGANAGSPIIVQGEVIETRGSVMLVDDRRGCSKGPCATRIVLSQEARIPRGSEVRAFGRLVRPFTTPAGQTVPEVEADFVLTNGR